MQRFPMTRAARRGQIWRIGSSLAERTATVLALTLLLLGTPILAQGPAHDDIGTFDQLLDDLDDGTLSLDDVRRLGMLVFTTPFNTLDGMGDGPFDLTEQDDPLAFGHRPTLQGNGLALRVNGLDAQSCNECHTLVRASTKPPTLGIGGVGGLVQNAIIMSSLIDVGDSSDDRVIFQSGHEPELPIENDGVADFNGRFANPPFLFGGGGVELVAKEMTEDLQKYLDYARDAAPGTVFELDTHGVHFGTITALGGGDVQVDAEGIGPEDPTGVDPEEILVVRPFGRKGENFSMRDFDRGAMQFHFGIQPVEVVGEDTDEDGDGVINEVTVAELTALHIFDVTNPRPVRAPLGAQGRRGIQTFRQVGCNGCHRPNIRTRSRKVPLAHPEIASAPRENVYLKVNLEKAGFRRAGSGVRVPMFSDLKRHKMGPALAETFERGEIANDEFVTARLWGIADSAPYLHDGRATTLRQAIELHGGEAQGVRDAFVALPVSEQEDLLFFLSRLRAPEAPNQELVQ